MKYCLIVVAKFMSELTQLFLLECKIVQLKTSPYHLQSNGYLETEEYAEGCW